MCDKLNNPNLRRTDRKEWKRQFRKHPTRILLQQQLQVLRNGQNQTEPIHNWFLLDSKGLLLAQDPAAPLSIGKNFAWRTYFHSGNRDYKDLQDYLNNVADEHVTKPQLSATLRSQHTDKPLWAVSAAVMDDGKFIGVVGLRVIIGQTPDASPGSP